MIEEEEQVDQEEEANQEIIRFDKVQKEYSRERLGFGSTAARNLKYTLIPYKVDLSKPKRRSHSRKSTIDMNQIVFGCSSKEEAQAWISLCTQGLFNR